MVTTTDIPTRAELVRRAADVAPILRKHADWAEENRRLHDEAVEAMAGAGIFRMRIPARYGGYESDLGTVVAVLKELGRGDGSAGWTASVWWIAGWMTGLFADSAQDDVFATPDVRVCGTLSPAGMAVRQNGGVIMNGRWPYNTGAWHSQWNVLAAMCQTGDGGMEPIMALAPLSDLDLVDDWNTSALRGSGSISTVAKDVFIPDERVLSTGAMLHEQYGSKHNADAPIYRAPLIPTAATTVSGTPIGLANAAQEVFFERLPDRHITYTSYDSQSDAPVTHLSAAEAALKTDEAEFHASRAASLIDAKSVDGQPLTVDERARVRADTSMACRLAKEAVDILAMSSGASSLYEDVPMQRFQRDVQGINLHAAMLPNTSLELYGRILCGREPNTMFL